jgi:cyclophilin family peptidyl-prolyl cis-trans isomerase
MLRWSTALLAVFPAVALAQSRADSALIGRILLAEDQRDSTSAALTEGIRHRDVRIATIAKRAAARIRDPKFAGRDSFPPLPPPPKYADPAWRLRFREVNAKRADCAAMRTALADSAWPVRLLAADRVVPECSSDSVLVRTLVTWAENPPVVGAHRRGVASWHPAAHAITALARLAPMRARALLPIIAPSPIPWLRVYAATAAGTLNDTTTLRRLARDRDDNVKEAAIDALSRVAGHVGDDAYIAALSSRGYQAVRAGARALKGSPRGAALLPPIIAAAERIRADSSETSRDARLALIERAGEFATATNGLPTSFAVDFDCAVAQAAAPIAARSAAPNVRIGARCTPLPITLPADAVSLALGRDVRLRVTLADSSGGGSFTVKLRGDVAPLMAARILALARSGYFNGRTWHRLEHDFVMQGGGGGSEYVGHPRFIRDELGTVPHARGTVGMSTRGHDTGDAQWFVNLRDNFRLNGDYTVFAEVIDGIDVVDGVLQGDVIARIAVVTP